MYSNRGQVVIAYRGTDDLEDAVADAQMAPGISQIPPHQSRQALEFYSECVRYCYNVRAVTGHSLGGALAKVVSQRNMILAVAFNAPYIGDLSGSAPMTSMLIKNYNSNLDPVSGATRLIGRMEEGQSEIIYIPAPSITDRLIDAGISAVTSGGLLPTPVMQGLHYHGVARLREVMAGHSHYSREIAVPGGV
jgi:hypothetical protein